jgi:uncharacterized membrane protein YbhN (UPF0104 family)
VPDSSPPATVTYLEPVDVGAAPLPEEFSASRVRRSLLIIAAIAAAVVAAVTLLPGLASLREKFAGAEPAWLAAAAVLEVLSCLSYVLVFRRVFCRQMSWTTSSEIGLSELAANSLLSAGGAGGLALGAWILDRGGVDRAHIARRTVAFFLVTSLANVGFLVLGGLALATGAFSGPGPLHGLIPAAVGLAGIGLALVVGRSATSLERRVGRPRIAAAVRALGAGVQDALALARDPGVLAGSAGYMLFDVAALGLGFVAFGNDLPPVGVLLVAYIVGQLGGLIPVPGGIGGLDGGLIGALVLYGVNAGDAAVAVLAYRGVLLAVPAALGLPALALLRRRLRSEANDIAACAPGQQVEVLGRGLVRTYEPVQP